MTATAYKLFSEYIHIERKERRKITHPISIVDQKGKSGYEKKG